jgi:hypothetical protein
MSKVTGKVNAVDYISENGYPEVGTFADQKALQKFYKQLDTAVLEDWCNLEGLEFKACPEQAPIHRMRAAMAILYKHFPKAPSTSKKKSKYGEYETAQLIQMALDNNVPVEVTENDQIMRMRVIMALRAHGVLEAK